MTIPLNAPSLTDHEERYIVDAFRSGWVTGGKYVARLETDFAAWVGRRHAVACSSGTSALWLALMALKLPAGQRVVTSSYTCDAVANATIHATGQPPICVDIEDETWGAHGGQVEQLLAGRLTFHVGAVILPHTYGTIARDTATIEAVCQRLGVPLIEDASEAHGASAEGRKAGSFGAVSIFSCRGEKLISGGQLGILLTDDAEIARRAHQYAHAGLPVDRLRFWSTVAGMNCQPAHLNAALACAQLERADELIAARRAVHAGWRARLEKYEGLTFQGVYGEPAPWLTGIRIGRAFTGMLVHDLARGLEERGIETRMGFYPIPRLPHCEPRHEPSGFSLAEGMTRITPRVETPTADALLNELLILPSGPTITPSQQDEVVAAILQITGRV